MGKLSFGTTGLSYEVKKVDFSSGNGAPKCPRCSERVYFNEEKKALGKSWHKKCFSCAKCKKSLDSTNANGHEGEIYCNTCHRRAFGPKGYGFAGGASGLATDVSARDILHRRSRSTSSTSSSSSGMVSPKSPTQPIVNGGGFEQQTMAKRLAPPVVDRDSMECCPRCGKRVYFAEEVKALKRKWHKSCFKCAVCKKMLDAGRCDGHQGEVYCNACYSRSFGPKGYGYGVGAGTLSTEADPHRFYKSTNPAIRTSSTTRNQSSQFQDSTYVPYQNGNGIRRDLNGTVLEWTEQQEDIRYMKKLAKELDQFEYTDY